MVGEVRAIISQEKRPLLDVSAYHRVAFPTNIKFIFVIGGPARYFIIETSSHLHHVANLRSAEVGIRMRFGGIVFIDTYTSMLFRVAYRQSVNKNPSLNGPIVLASRSSDSCSSRQTIRVQQCYCTYIRMYRENGCLGKYTHESRKMRHRNMV